MSIGQIKHTIKVVSTTSNESLRMCKISALNFKQSIGVRQQHLGGKSGKKE